jgi:predicted DsbA family dithiol-disulfide isomerase
MAGDNSYPGSSSACVDALSREEGRNATGLIDRLSKRSEIQKARPIGVVMNLAVDVISDVICPWCYIGKKRLEKAVAALEGQHDVRVRWLPFQLNPTIPKEGISRKEYRIRKFGSWERSQELDAKLVAVGESEGIRFAFDRIERTPNTVDAHRLIWLADQQGCQNAIVESLFVGYFTEGRDITDRQTLIDVVADAGLERRLAGAMLNSDEGMNAIKEAEALSRRLRVDGVPFFIVNNKISLSGAQQPDTFLDAFREANRSR